jgi:hypothetical protein
VESALAGPEIHYCNLSQGTVRAGLKQAVHQICWNTLSWGSNGRKSISAGLGSVLGACHGSRGDCGGHRAGHFDGARGRCGHGSAAGFLTTVAVSAAAEGAKYLGLLVVQ